MTNSSWTRRVAGALPTLAACVGMLGCGASAQSAVAPHQHWVPGYAFGLYGRADLDTRDDCPSTGAASIRIGTTWSTLLVSVATLGVYTPREVRVQCKPR